MIKTLLVLALLVGAAPSSRWTKAEYAGAFTDPDLAEVSGLAASRTHPGMYWAHNDGNNRPELVAIRPDGTRVASARSRLRRKLS